MESVGTFVGRDPRLSVPENLREGEKVLPELWEWMFGLGLYLNWDPSHLDRHRPPRDHRAVP